MLPTFAIKRASVFLLAGALSFSQVRLMVQQEPLAIAQARLHTTAKLPLGMCRITLWLPRGSAAPVIVSREEIEMAVPAVTFLSKETALPILIARNGGIWRQLAHYGMLAGMLAPGALSGATISARAVRWIGAGLAGVEVVRKDLDAQTPDISGLTIELPASVVLQPGGGASFEVWVAKMKGARHAWGPITLE